MSAWIIFWGIVVLFSIISFAYMSGKILIKSVAELKEMFSVLDDQHRSKIEG